MKSLRRVRLFVTPWTITYQAYPSMAFSRQEYWSGLPFPSPEYLPKPGINPRSPALQADSSPSEPPGKSIYYINVLFYDLALDFAFNLVIIFLTIIFIKLNI